MWFIGLFMNILYHVQTTSYFSMYTKQYKLKMYKSFYRLIIAIYYYQLAYHIKINWWTFLIRNIDKCSGKLQISVFSIYIIYYYENNINIIAYYLHFNPI